MSSAALRELLSSFDESNTNHSREEIRDRLLQLHHMCVVLKHTQNPQGEDNSVEIGKISAILLQAARHLQNKKVATKSIPTSRERSEPRPFSGPLPDDELAWTEGGN